MRLPKQVLIIPYRITNNKIEYCIFKRKELQIWQWISGGAEDFDKDILETAKREFFEETQISDVKIEALEARTTIPVVGIMKDFVWGKDVFFATEYTFATNIGNKQITLGDEHEEYRWVDYEKARDLLKFDSNRNALWELDVKLKRRIESEDK